MKTFTIFKYTIIRYWRDKGSVFQSTLQPFVFILILGLALSSQFDVRETEPVRVVLVEPAQALPSERELMSALRSASLQAEESGLLSMVGADSETEARELLASDQAEAVLTYRPETGRLELLGKSGNDLRSSIPGRFYGNRLQMLSAMQFVGADSANLPELVGSMGTTPIAPLELNDIRSAAGSMDYYSVTMLVMTLLFGTMFASYGLSEDLLRAVGQRMSAAPLVGFEQYLGKVAGSALFVWLLGIVLTVATGLVFGVPWFHNFGAVLAVCAAISVFSTAVGALSIIVLRSEELSGMVLNLLILAWTLFAGGFILLPRNRITYVLELITPNTIAQRALFNLLYWEQPGITAQSIAILLGLSCLAGCAAILIGMRRRS